MTSAQSRFVVGAVAVAFLVLVIVGIVHYRSQPGPAQQPERSVAPPATAPGPSPSTPRAVTTAVAPTTSVQPAPPLHQAKPVSPAERADALAKFKGGMDLLGKNELVAARAALADALNAAALPPQQEKTCRASLENLVQQTIFARRVIPGDPCTFWYKFAPGEVLVRVERKLKLHVPDRLILLINGIPDATKIRAGQRLKMLRGPFHAVVSKGRFTMDVYLAEPKTGRMIFVKRLAVGTGKDGSTPMGRWRVKLGGKMDRAAWTPPLSSDLPQKKILWGQPGYPLGRKGYWIGMEGIEGNPHTAEDGYGIHGTHDTSSIGRASSMGCIRLTDEDIELVFAMLYEKWSTVTVIR